MYFLSGGKENGEKSAQSRAECAHFRGFVQEKTPDSALRSQNKISFAEKEYSFSGKLLPLQIV